ncbi:hypothetical protein BDZ97DRAFT_1796976, partial [Flammula alnicola]
IFKYSPERTSLTKLESMSTASSSVEILYTSIVVESSLCSLKNPGSGNRGELPFYVRTRGRQGYPNFAMQGQIQLRLDAAKVGRSSSGLSRLLSQTSLQSLLGNTDHSGVIRKRKEGVEGRKRELTVWKSPTIVDPCFEQQLQPNNMDKDITG